MKTTMIEKQELYTEIMPIVRRDWFRDKDDQGNLLDTETARQYDMGGEMARMNVTYYPSEGFGFIDIDLPDGCEDWLPYDNLRARLQQTMCTSSSSLLIRKAIGEFDEVINIIEIYSPAKKSELGTTRPYVEQVEEVQA